MQLGGDYFFPGKGISHLASLRLQDQSLLVTTDEGERFEFELRNTQVNPRLGQINRTFRFADGSLFECPQTVKIDQWLYAQQGHSVQSLVHRFESSWTWVGLVLLIGGLFAYLLIDRGVPRFSGWIASELPASLSHEVGSAIFETLDNNYLQPSQLNSARQQALRAQFRQLLEAHPAGSFLLPPQLVFRGGGKIGTNALALPNGVVIFTDEIIELAPSDDALAGVMAHELGHLVYQHGMQMAVSATVIPIFLTVVAGDLVNSSQLASVLPVLLLSNGYSRRFEKQADSHAKEVFHSLGKSTQPIAEFFTLMAKQAADEEGGNSLFSTHPGYADRISYFQEAGR